LLDEVVAAQGEHLVARNGRAAHAGEERRRLRVNVLEALFLLLRRLAPLRRTVVRVHPVCIVLAECERQCGVRPRLRVERRCGLVSTTGDGEEEQNDHNEAGLHTAANLILRASGLGRSPPSLAHR
jgi:hypothetical protein